MGPLSIQLPPRICVDAQILIYSVEKFPRYQAALDWLWDEISRTESDVFTSELSLLEVSVGPLRTRDEALLASYERVLSEGPLLIVPIGTEVLRRAARLRADVLGLRTPDSIHASTAMETGCQMFLTNDYGFRAVKQLNGVILDDLLSA